MVRKVENEKEEKDDDDDDDDDDENWESIIRNITMTTASLTMPSPKRIELSLGKWDSFIRETAETVSLEQSRQERIRISSRDS